MDKMHRPEQRFEVVIPAGSYSDSLRGVLLDVLAQLSDCLAQCDVMPPGMDTDEELADAYLYEALNCYCRLMDTDVEQAAIVAVEKLDEISGGAVLPLTDPTDEHSHAPTMLH